jgi:hypothetical protein
MTPSRPAPAAAPIRARRVRFDWSDTPLHWVPGDPQTTHTINVLHLLLPAGERWFVDVYRQALPLVTDDRLRDDVRGFMGQEAVHSRSHTGVLEHLAAQGLDPAGFTRWVEWLFARPLADAPFGRRLPGPLQRRWLVRRLAVIAAIEHFTAVLGDWIVTESAALDEAGADPVMLDLLRWHGAEEVEHRSVAFDLHRHVGGGFLDRAAAMVVTFPVFMGFWVAGVRYNLRHDPLLSGRARRLSGRALLAAGRRGVLPTVSSVLRAVPSYLARDFHPSHDGDAAAATAYLAASPAVA